MYYNLFSFLTKDPQVNNVQIYLIYANIQTCKDNILRTNNILRNKMFYYHFPMVTWIQLFCSKEWSLAFRVVCVISAIRWKCRG